MTSYTYNHMPATHFGILNRLNDKFTENVSLKKDKTKKDYRQYRYRKYWFKKITDLSNFVDRYCDTEEIIPEKVDCYKVETYWVFPGIEPDRFYSLRVFNSIDSHKKICSEYDVSRIHDTSHMHLMGRIHAPLLKAVYVLSSKTALDEH